MTSFTWSAEFELGYDKMDDTHREFVQLVNALASAADVRVAPLLDEFIAHTEAHFTQESRWMQGSGFPPIHCHETEHERVIEVIREVKAHVAAGDLELGRTLARELPEWFRDHAATMDAALANWLKQTQWVAA